MAVESGWPYVQGNHKTESDEHVQMKNLAVLWLQRRGFSLDDIEDERPYYVENKQHCLYTDIYAAADGVEIFIECKPNKATVGDMRGGARHPAKDEKLVYVFDPRGIHELIYEWHEVPKKRGEGTVGHNRFRLERKWDLPQIDLSAYKED